LALAIGSLQSPSRAQQPAPRAQRPDLSTPEGVLSYVLSHRDDAALVAYSVNADGTIDKRDTVLWHNADRPMPLASTIKVITLATYARAVVDGQLDPAEQVPVTDWEKFYLPARDGLAHPNALENYFGLPTDDFGFAVDRGAAVSLDDLVAVMLQFSDNAAADYLLDRLGAATFRATIRAARLTGQELPQSISGVFLSWVNHEMPDPSWADVRRLVTMNAKRYAARVSGLAATYAGDEDWRSQELAWIATLPTIQFARITVLENELFPHGTARDYAGIMARVMTDTFISPAVSAVMRRQLEWPLRYIPAPFSSWGHKGGSLDGVLTDANFFVPSEGPFVGHRRVAVLFLRYVPQWASAEFARTLGQNLFDREIAIDPAFADWVAAALGRRSDH
jgi:hypothetical protein